MNGTLSHSILKTKIALQQQNERALSIYAGAARMYFRGRPCPR